MRRARKKRSNKKRLGTSLLIESELEGKHQQAARLASSSSHPLQRNQPRRQIVKKNVDKEGKLKFTDAKKKASEGMKIKDAGEDGSHEWQGLEVRVVSEMAGNFALGRPGT